MITSIEYLSLIRGNCFDSQDTICVQVSSCMRPHSTRNTAVGDKNLLTDSQQLIYMVDFDLCKGRNWYP